MNFPKPDYISICILMLLCNGCVYIGSNQVGESTYPPGEGWEAVEAKESVVHITAYLQGDQKSYGIPWIFLFERDSLPYQLYLVFAVPEEQPAERVVITYLKLDHHGLFGDSYILLEGGEEITGALGFDDMSQWDLPSRYRSRISVPSSVKSRSDFRLTIHGYLITRKGVEMFEQILKVNSKEKWYLTPSFIAQPLRNAFGYYP